MADNRKRLGAFGERVAAEHLKNLGYTILECNFRCAIGEIDIVAQDDDSLVFVEVRTKRDQHFGTPEESITLAKKARLVELAETYLQEHQDSPEFWRIDVVAVEISGFDTVSRIELVKNAID